MSNTTDETGQRSRNRWGEGIRLRTEILDAAGRLLSELDGEDALTIRGVARAVGIAPASIYQHFADRTELVQGLLEHEFARLQVLLDKADAQADPEDMIGRVRAQVFAYGDFATTHPGHYRLLLSATSRQAPENPPEPLMKILAMFATAFDRCRQAGHQVRLPPDRCAVMVVVSTHGLVALAQPRTATVPDRLRQNIEDLLTLILG
ncbi:TetR/AcrR family transcriptional regulator [Amycolatopsis sp. FDAARGOS 1241]|uniref:TetR/AcrR family transcriptional regulator n=1 Tax=Amycolatopsis sp. FDAARGOS 1241 TaxID=2778070 RepID=UPI0019528B8F|nr:TetR/AcrR family transcriptional regulator [Amycolatopsis sp. FDAARGOS 1241]QRP48244.1 TetR/AcrR family transcriptional regulator [Amycolatopsis sp. FDAARGOS 1241]